VKNCPDCMTDENAIGQGVRCPAHELAYLRSTIAAKDAELARLRGVEAEARKLVEQKRFAGGTINFGPLCAVLALPSPAEAGENPSLPPTPPCGDKTWTHPSDCHVCRQLRAAPSDAKAGDGWKTPPVEMPLWKCEKHGARLCPSLECNPPAAPSDGAGSNLVRVANHIHGAEMEQCQQPRGSIGRAVCDARGCKCNPPAAPSDAKAGECPDCGRDWVTCPRWTRTPNGGGGFYVACCPDCRCPQPGEETGR
jgi:hypothetical protein